MDRKEFLQALEIVAPALAAKTIVPVMADFWFYGDRVMAFNDEIAISTPLETPFKGAVPGATLLALLHASGARALTFEQGDGQLIIKASRATLKLKLYDPSYFIFDMPEDDPADNLMPDKPEKLFTAIEGCLRSVSMDAAIPEQLGITFMSSGKPTDLYATDSDTLSHEKVELRRGIGGREGSRVIVPTAFCRELLRLGRGVRGVRLSINDHALMVAGRTCLYGRLVQTHNPLDFAGVIQNLIPSKNKLYPMPKGFGYALERASVISDAKVDSGKTSFRVENGKLHMLSASGRGEVSDDIPIDPKQGKMASKMRAKLLKVGHKEFDKILLTDRCAIMAKGESLYLVSATVI